MGQKTQIRGAPRVGAGAIDEGDLTRAVVGSYSTLTQAEAQEQGQAAAAAVLPARRELWALAERLIPRRLAAALRARLSTSDATGRDGVRELRLALADWLDPHPACRRCGLPIREGDAGRVCAGPRRAARPSGEVDPARVMALAEAYLAGLDAPPPAPRPLTRRRWTPRPVACRPARASATAGTSPGLGPSSRCGTLALLPAGLASPEVIAAALACPAGAARSYDVAADRDGRALTAATAPAPPRDPADEGAWSDEGLRLLYAAVAGLPEVRAGVPLPAAVAASRKRWRALRGEHARANGRAALGVQLRYGVPGGGACRADLVQGAAMGSDRAVADYDATKAKFTTYGAAWIRQGLGEAREGRDLVGTPSWVTELRARLLDRLPGVEAADLLRAAEALAEAGAGPSPARAASLSADLARLLLAAEVRENVSGSRPARYVRRPLFADGSDDHAEALAAAALRAALPPRRRPSQAETAEDPERARERVAGWVARTLRVEATGSGVLSALRHRAPTFVQVGAGGDDGEDAQGTDGAGGLERAAHVLAAPDDAEALVEEAEARDRWQRALAALEGMRGAGGERGREVAEVVRRHAGLDGIAEDAGGRTGESFQSIAETGLACSGRRLTKETIRKMHREGVEALRRALATGDDPVLADGDGVEDEVRAVAPARQRRSVWRPIRPANVVSVIAPPVDRHHDDGAEWLAPPDPAAIAW